MSVNVIKTTGDMVLDKALSELGGKGKHTHKAIVPPLAHACFCAPTPLCIP